MFRVFRVFYFVSRGIFRDVVAKYLGCCSLISAQNSYTTPKQFYIAEDLAETNPGA